MNLPLSVAFNVGQGLSVLSLWGKGDINTLDAFDEVEVLYETVAHVRSKYGLNFGKPLPNI